MWTETAEGRDLVKVLTKEVVAETAPEELELFDEMIQEHFEAPGPSGSATYDRDDPLGFGLSEAMTAVTPAAAAMVTAVLSYVLTESIKATQEEGAAAIKKKIKSLFSPKKESQGPAPLTGEQLEQVKKLARKQATEFGIEAGMAEKMANALIGSIALAG